MLKMFLHAPFRTADASFKLNHLGHNSGIDLLTCITAWLKNVLILGYFEIGCFKICSYKDPFLE